ncbi:MAG: cytochrome c-type biogenesis CcmF C-terminal domain-containing protein, partial [Nitrososphaerales archaeon]
SGIGPIFSTYLGLTLAASLAILAYKFDQVKSMNIFQSATGREASFLFNNLFFVVMAMTVIWGTLFPMLNEAVVHTKISVGPGFYNAIVPWVLLSLVVLMGVCIVLRWGTTSTDELIRKLKYPSALTVASAPIFYLLGFSDIGSLIGLTASVFAVSLHLEDYVFDVRDYARNKGIRIFSSMYRILLLRRRRYGGYIVHLSMFMIFIGLIGTTIYQTTHTSTLQEDMPVDIAGYTITYEGFSVSEDPTQTEYIVRLLVSNGNGGGTLTARIIEDHQTQSTRVSVGVLSLPFEDIYVIPESIDQNQVSLTINYTPLIGFIWIGGQVMIIGVIISLLPKRWAER